jgi:hypothetical protein
VLQRFKSKTSALFSESAISSLLERALRERDAADATHDESVVVRDVPVDNDGDDDNTDDGDDELRRITASASSAATPQRRQEALALVESRRQSIVNTPEPSLWEQERISNLEALARGSPFEHFLVVGLPAECGILTASVRNEPQILFQYSPRTADQRSREPSALVDSVRHFCFPRGVTTELLAKRASGSGLSSLLVGHEAMACFTFVLDSANEQLFGCCMVSRESLFDVGSWQMDAAGNTTSPAPAVPAAPAASAAPTRAKRGGFYAPLGTRRATPTKGKPPPKTEDDMHGRFIVVTDRVYCFVSRVPYFALHFDVLRLFVGHERLIKLAGVMGVEPDNGLRPIEVIRAYGAGKLAMPGDTVSIELPRELRPYCQLVPLADTADEVRCRVIADFATSLLVRHVSLVNLLQLFTAALLEQRIIVRGTNAGAVSCVVMALRPLVMPFVLRGLFIPILPSHLIDYMHAPVPFIMGVHSLDAGAGDWLLCDVDAGSLDVPADLDMPRLPGFQQLLAKAKAPFIKLRELTSPTHSPLNNTKEQINASRELNAVFHDYCEKLVGRLEAHFLPLLLKRTLEPFGESAAAARQSFVEKNAEHHAFFELLLNTQHVAVWIHALFAKASGAPKD